MAILATDSTRFTAVVKYELEPQLSICRESVVLNDAAGGTYKTGAVLGKVTATGKYVLSASAAADGSQTPVAILITDGLGSSTDVVLTAGVDAKALVLARGPAIVTGPSLQLGVGITLAAAKTALAAVGITVETGL